jgi:CubicO group peptidase (beta-lactamase class C family)
MLAERVEAGDFPAAVYLVAERGRARFADALGEAVREPERRAATAETIFDLASLTKPLVTGMLLALLVERGAVGLDSPVAERLAQFGAGDKRGVTVRHLLTHTSGLPAWQPLYATAGARSKSSPRSRSNGRRASASSTATSASSRSGCSPRR